MTGDELPIAQGEDLSDFQIFERLYPALRRFAAVVADIDVDPDDLVQEALAATLRRHDLSEIRQPAAYLKQAIVNAAVGHRRRAGRFRLLLPRLAGEAATDDHYPSDLSILDRLQPTDRAVIVLADVEGLPYAVIADELGLTVGAVKKRVSRSRRELRRLLGSNLSSIDEVGS